MWRPCAEIVDSIPACTVGLPRVEAKSSVSVQAAAIDLILGPPGRRRPDEPIYPVALRPAVPSAHHYPDHPCRPRATDRR